MSLRIRIRGPSGQSTATFDEGATVETLKKQISELTSLPAFDIKCGYPPKPLDLSGYEPAKLLSELDVKLNGEQLLVTRAEDSESTKAPDVVNAQRANDASGTSNKATAPTSETSQPSSSQRAPATPLSLTRKANKEMSDPPEIFIPDVGGTLLLRIMPDDNSCLFRAISSAVISDIDAVTELRSIVAETIQADPETYNKAVLDNKDPDKYCRWIRSQDSWGGQVELVILSQHFGVEICSIDVQTLRADRYNEGAEKRCFVVYSGIHYDTIALSLPGMAPEDDVKQFESPIKDEILPKAIELCKKLQEKHYYTDTSGFRLRCNDCGAMLVGERGATEHAASTGHYNFGEAT
ncbi:ubiquitin-specific protease otu1 [Neophaeococcomyces mojaviensis]|uniref:Ubiquitin-specific protease otu1 n=1 Tax=Neophaeococcomyces mojaviensis TaxID=3383035 RepID=A0ACC3A5B2_9EURO|nr:ubiquitin-specific protease otu1 [Knufia sp. JES_112]